MSATHWTQLPLESQNPVPPLRLGSTHAVPTGREVVPHTPAVQVATWHGLLLGGQSAAEAHPLLVVVVLVVVVVVEVEVGAGAQRRLVPLTVTW